MKKIYTLLLAAALGATAANAQQTVFIGSTGYDDIPSAVAAAVSGDVIIIKGETVLTKKVDFTKETDIELTFRGEGNAVIKREGSDVMFIMRSKNKYTFENITFDGANTNKLAIENKQTNTTLNIKDCKFVNIPGRAVQTKSTTLLTNVDMASCKAADNDGAFYVGVGNKVTLAGASNYSVYIESNYKIAQGENFSGNVDIRLQTYAPKTIVSGVTEATASYYTMSAAPEGFKLVFDNGNLNLVSFKAVVKNETTGATYSSLEEALTNMTVPEEGQNVLVVLENIDVNDRIGTNSGIQVCTIKGATPEVTLKRTFTNKAFVSNNKGLVFEDLVLDCNNCGSQNFDIQSNQNNATLALKNVKVINSAAKNCVFDVKDGNRVLLLDNCTGENITAPNIVNLNGKLQLNGNTNFNVRIANAGASITATGELTNEAPIEISFADGIIRNDGDVIVNGTAQTDKFKLTNGKFLNAVEGNLVMSSTEQTGIEDVELTANALVNVYNMQGVMVKENVNRADACAGLTPGLYVVGGKKTLVR